MKLKEIYELAINLGMAADPRGVDGVRKYLERRQLEYNEMSEKQKAAYDRDRLTNPYADTQILYGDADLEVMSVISGIDINVGEILLGDRLRQRGIRIDLAIAHHPSGKAIANLYDVLHVQEDLLHNYGVPINIAEGILHGRVKEIERAIMPLNHNQAVDAARLMDLPLLCVHTPADNLVTKFLQDLFDTAKPELVSDVIELLKEIPEYKQAAAYGAGPKVVAGDEQRRCGKIMVEMTGGTEGAIEAYAKLAAAGVGTLIGMHYDEKHRKEAEKNHLNVIIAGHIASDSLGMNLFLDELQKRGIKIQPCSGLIRVERS